MPVPITAMSSGRTGWFGGPITAENPRPRPCSVQHPCSIVTFEPGNWINEIRVIHKVGCAVRKSMNVSVHRQAADFRIPGLSGCRAWHVPRPMRVPVTPAQPQGAGLASLDACRQIQAIAARGDRAAFGALFAYFAPRVKAYALRLGVGNASAEDIAQETMLVVWRKAAYFDARKASAATWIFPIARNLRIDALRRERYPTAEFEFEAVAVDATPGIDDQLATVQQEARMRHALHELPEEQATVVRLSFFDDKPHREIERELGI